MKKVLLLAISVMAITACSHKKIYPSYSWRINPKVRTKGYRISIMPVDTRVKVIGKSTKKEYRDIWRNGLKSGLSIMKSIPTLLMAKSYDVVEQLYWSGRSVTPDGHISNRLSQKDLARSFYALAYFAGLDYSGPLRHSVSPSVFKKLSNKSDYTLYVGNWYKVKVVRKSALMEFLKTTLIVVGVAVVVVGIVVAIAAVAASAKGGGGGGALKGVGNIFAAGGKLFLYGARGLVHGFGRIFTSSIIRAAGKAAYYTARIATRVVVRSYIENGPLIIDLPPAEIRPYPVQQTRIDGAPDTMNPYTGVTNGISAMSPTIKKPGYLLSFVLVENRSGAVKWDGKIWVPQGAKTKNLKIMIKKVFMSMPRGAFKQAPAIKAPTPDLAPAHATAVN